jgi:hypothetical protein
MSELTRVDWPDDGELFVNLCPDCNETNGMGVINEQFPHESYESDLYDPINVPCIWCGKGPMIQAFARDLVPDQKAETRTEK